MGESVVMEMPKVIGADLGNDSLKVVLDERTHFTIKNAVSRRLLNEVNKDLSFDTDTEFNGEEGRKNKLNNLDVIIRPANGAEQRFFIGDHAIAAGEDETIVGTEKAENPYIHIPLLAILAYQTPKSQKVARFKDVSGLPIKQFTKEARMKMAERLIGEFEVTLMNPDGSRGRKVQIIIEDAKIVPEGVPVVFNQMLNAQANDFTRPELRVSSRGVVDIGAFTTDIPIVVKGKPDSMQSDGLDEGISTYIDRIAKSLSEITKATVTRNQILNKILDDDIDEISIRGKRYPLRAEIEDQLAYFAKRIIDVVDRLWAKNYEIEEFFVVGGGGKMLKRYLQEQLATRDFELTFIEPRNKSDVQNDPQLQNAFGYWKLAKQQYGA